MKKWIYAIIGWLTFWAGVRLGERMERSNREAEDAFQKAIADIGRREAERVMAKNQSDNFRPFKEVEE